MSIKLGIMYCFLAFTIIGGSLFLFSEFNKIPVEKECRIGRQIVKGTTCKVLDFKNDFHKELQTLGVILVVSSISGIPITPMISDFISYMKIRVMKK